MGKKRATESAVPGMIEQTLDLEALKAAMIAKANAEVPAAIKAMTPEQCRAELSKQFPVMRAWTVELEPGEEG